MAILRADLSGKRLRELAAAATEVFCRRGFERSQMSDVAKLMGVAVGTVYLYVASKEALFDLAIRCGAAGDPGWLDTVEIPLATPPPGSTLAYLKEVFDRTEWPALADALGKDHAGDPAAELDAILREQYALMRRHRQGLLLLMRSALEFPGLAQVFVHGLRDKLLDHLSRLFERRIAAGQYRPLDDVLATAAVTIQAIAWANLQRPLDPGLAGMDDATVETATIQLLVHGIVARPTS